MVLQFHLKSTQRTVLIIFQNLLAKKFLVDQNQAIISLQYKSFTLDRFFGVQMDSIQTGSYTAKHNLFYNICPTINKTKDWASVQNAALFGVEICLV